MDGAVRLLHFTMVAASVTTPEEQGMEKQKVAPGPSLAVALSFPTSNLCEASF